MTASTKTLSVGLYGRASTSDQHPENQIHDLRQLAEQRGWRVQGIYVDHGISGSRDRRPQLDKLMAAVHCGEVDVVAVWRFDRFARSLRHLVSALEDFRARGVEFVSLHDGVDTSTPTGRLTFYLVAALAEFERELIRERTRAGMAAAKRKGIRVGRPRKQIPVAKARMLLAQGMSYRDVAKALGCGASTLHKKLREADGLRVHEGSEDEG